MHRDMAVLAYPDRFESAFLERAREIVRPYRIVGVEAEHSKVHRVSPNVD
jgi:hypothetical protein